MGNINLIIDSGEFIFKIERFDLLFGFSQIINQT